MWQRLSLSLKLIISLILVQASILALVTVWLSHWVETNRIHEIRLRLDTESDVFEDLVGVDAGKLTYHRTGEVSEEIARDLNRYFFLIDHNQQLLADDGGPSVEIKSLLRQQAVALSVERESATRVIINNIPWLIHNAPVERQINGDMQTAQVFIAVNIQDQVHAIEQFRQVVLLAAIAVLLLTALCTGIVVSYSTSNLRRFAEELRSLRPPTFEGRRVLLPQSAEEKLLFDSYKEMTATVQLAVEQQRLFIANASHEFKSPIAAAMSALEVLLSRERQIEDYKTTCHNVLREIRVLGRLSGVLLDMAKLEIASNKQESSALATAVARVVDRWTSQAALKQITISVEPPKQEVPAVRGSLEQWEIVLGNLVDNAIKYGKTGGKVWITWQCAGAGMTIHVKDDGIGITPAHVERLGTVFFRADTARSAQDSFGLGFAHAQRIVQSFGASLQVQSTLRVGTTVTIQSPLV